MFNQYKNMQKNIVKSIILILNNSITNNKSHLLNDMVYFHLMTRFIKQTLDFSYVTRFPLHFYF